MTDVTDVKRPDEVLSPLEKKAISDAKNFDIRNSTQKNYHKSSTKNPVAKYSTKSTTKNPVAKYSKSTTKNPGAKQCPMSGIKSEEMWKDDMHVTDSADFPQKNVIRGSFHQGDRRFGYNRNRQCALNSLTALMMSKLKNVLTWTRDDLDAVLLHGDQLYTSMRRLGKINDPTRRGYIAVAELPTMQTFCNTHFSMTHLNPTVGMLDLKCMIMHCKMFSCLLMKHSKGRFSSVMHVC